MKARDCNKSVVKEFKAVWLSSAIATFLFGIQLFNIYVSEGFENFS